LIVMSDAWLPVLNFERTGSLLGAINALTIHHKLLLAGREDQARDEEARRAVEVLKRFLSRVASVAAANREQDHLPTLGADPRLARLISSGPGDGGLGLRELAAEVMALLDSSDVAAQRSLVGALGELRSLLERQVQNDAAGIVGDV
jgi:hypothetical protein